MRGRTQEVEQKCTELPHDAAATVQTTELIVGVEPAKARRTLSSTLCRKYCLECGLTSKTTPTLNECPHRFPTTVDRVGPAEVRCARAVL